MTQSGSEEAHRADDEREDVPLFHPADAFRDWASPEEVLNMRALWSDVLLKHKVEVTALTQELEKVKEERDTFAKAVMENERLKQLYLQGQREYEAAKVERNRWREERQMLILQLQQLTNDKLMREGGRGGGAGGSSGEGGSNRLPSNSDQDSGSIGRPSTLTSTSSQQSLWIQNQVLFDENLSLLEQINRAEWRTKEIASRSELQTSLLNMSLQRLQQRFHATARELQEQQAIAKNLEDQLLHSQQVTERLESRLELSEQARQSTVSDLSRQVEFALQRAQLSIERPLATQYEEELESRCGKLHRAWCDAVAERDSLQSQLEEERRKSRDSFLGTQEQAESKEKAALAALRESREAHRQEKAALVDQLDQETQSNRAAQLELRRLGTLVQEQELSLQNFTDRLDQSLKLEDELKTELNEARDRIHQLEADLQLARVDQDQLQNTAAERDALLQRLTALQDEVEAQKHFYENQLVRIGKAMQLLQTQGDQRADLLLKQLYKYERILARQGRGGSGTAAPSTKKGQRQSTLNNNDTDAPAATTDSDQAPAAAASPIAVSGGVDALSILKGTAAVASHVQRLVNRSS
jgi:hypothetical protein